METLAMPAPEVEEPRARRDAATEAERAPVSTHRTDALFEVIAAIHALVAEMESVERRRVVDAEEARSVLLDATALLDALVEHTADEASFVEGAEVSGLRDHDALGDFLFLSRAGIARRLEAPPFDGACVGDERDERLVASLHETYKGLLALERMLSARLGRSARTDALSSRALLAALRTRHAYVGLRAEICALASLAEADVAEALGVTAGVLGRFLEKDVLHLMRRGDRRALRALYGRVSAFVSASDSLGEGERRREGTRPHQDVLATIDLVFGINLRAELVEHDATRIASALEMLRALPPRQSSVPLTIRAQLTSLLGRSRRLDVMLEARDRIQRETLEHLLGELSSALFGSGAYAF